MKFLIFLSLPVLLAFAAGCMNKNPTQPAESHDLVLKLTIQPPTFTRTSATKALWLSPISADLPLEKDAHEASHYEPASMTVGNLYLSVTADSGRSMDMYMAGSWMVMPPDSHHVHVGVTLLEAGTEGDLPGPLPVLYSTVTLKVTETGSPRDSAVLSPVYGANGNGYGGNLTFPLGMYEYTLTAKATAPQLSMRDGANAGRLHNDLTASCNIMLHSVNPDGEIIGNSLQTDSIRFEFYAKPPETLYVWDAVNRRTIETPPASNATIYVEVRILDLKSKGAVKAVGYSDVRCRLYTHDLNDSTATTTPFLTPVHGSKGFYYGDNMPLPEAPVAGGGHGH